MNKGKTMKFLQLVIVLIFLNIGGCAKYVTPGSGVKLSKLSDASINELLAKQPAANFPANISVARIQAPDYRSYRVESYGTGRYSVVTTREVETESDFNQIASLPGIAGLAPLNRILLPENLDSVKALREASARLRTDILLIYTFDTSFHAGEQTFAPLNTISLGFLKNKKITVTTTVSAAFFDVRTEFLYGIAETTVKQEKQASVWSEASVVDDLRVLTERDAFQKLLPEIALTWSGIFKQYGKQK